eukprot:c23370_g1_i1.p1 GENE.c23370_g1_i1~~c23370_g1_i1.p1  ORF type:complete len:117 (+),score=9.82 c23370_g1_i1:63-413(+)
MGSTPIPTGSKSCGTSQSLKLLKTSDPFCSSRITFTRSFRTLCSILSIYASISNATQCLIFIPTLKLNFHSNLYDPQSLKMQSSSGQILQPLQTFANPVVRSNNTSTLVTTLLVSP